jgi:hypothetical protein
MHAQAIFYFSFGQPFRPGQRGDRAPISLHPDGKLERRGVTEYLDWIPDFWKPLASFEPLTHEQRN